jgi:hypothetical protein
MNVAYKHLDSKLRIADLTVGQWLGVIAGLGIAFVWGFYLSPFGMYVTLMSAIYVGGIPIGATLLASVGEFDLWLLVRSAVRWRREDGRFIPGPGGSSRGYSIREDPHEMNAAGARRQLADLDPASLWEDK